MQLTPSVPSPQLVGAGVGLTATAECTDGTPEYLFEVAAPSGVLSVLRDFGASPETIWDSAGLTPGS